MKPYTPPPAPHPRQRGRSPRRVPNQHTRTDIVNEGHGGGKVNGEGGENLGPLTMETGAGVTFSTARVSDRGSDVSNEDSAPGRDAADALGYLIVGLPRERSWVFDRYFREGDGPEWVTLSLPGAAVIGMDWAAQ